MVAVMGQDATAGVHGSVPGRPSGFSLAWEKWRGSMSQWSRWWLVAAAVVTAALWVSHMPALLFHAHELPPYRQAVAIVSGGNVAPEMLADVLVERD